MRHRSISKSQWSYATLPYTRTCSVQCNCRGTGIGVFQKTPARFRVAAHGVAGRLAINYEPFLELWELPLFIFTITLPSLLITITTKIPLSYLVTCGFPGHGTYPFFL